MLAARRDGAGCEDTPPPSLPSRSRTALSRSFAAILTPWAASISLKVVYAFLTRSSFSGSGISSDRTVVTMGPSNPHRTMVSPCWVSCTGQKGSL